MVIPAFRLVEPTLATVRARISGLSRAENAFVGELAGYALAQKGQLLRPSFLLTCSLLGGRETAPDPAISLAAMVELLHCASLLHDDVVDQGRYRRQVLTVNAKWGNKEAVLLGDFVLALALDLLSDFPDSRILKSGARITHTLALGQLLELQHVGDMDLDEAGYLAVIGSKTADFFAECAYLGGLAAGLPDGALASLARAGRWLGLTYQVLDDLLDLIGSSSGMGKDTRTDPANGILTLPVLHTLSEAAPAGPRARLRALLAPGAAASATGEIRDLVVSGGGAARALARAREFSREAQGELDRLAGLCAAPVVAALRELPAYMFERAEAGGDATGAARGAADAARSGSGLAARSPGARA
jgi:octaprenyl-diphosphate synthase